MVADDGQPSTKLQTVQRRKTGATAAATGEGNDDTRNHKKKKIIHRDVERQRRHEMAMLYSSLRSLLPIEYLKGKRSISDHMNEAANYIKHQRKKIGELTEKRDGLRRLVSSAGNSGSLHMNGGFTSPTITVRPCLAGVEVVMGCSPLLDPVPLSTVIELLEEEGLGVVNCVFTNVNDQLLYTLQCEISGQKELDLQGLEQKLMDLIGPSSWLSR